MSSIATILLLTLFQFLIGFGVLSLLKLSLKIPITISLSILTGVAAMSFLPFFLQLMFIPLTAQAVFFSIGVLCILLNLKSFAAFRQFISEVRQSKFVIRIYEIPSLVIIAFIIWVSVWRCFYLPPLSRDFTSGAEAIATYTITEKTMINSVFSVNMESTNNPFKPPFLTSLQIIYKYAGFVFGQIWLSTVFIAFIIFLYHVISAKIHRFLSGLLIIIFLAIPEMYAYTFMGLYDYSNAVYFCLSLFFLFEFFKNEKRNYLLASSIFLGISTYIRSETAILGCLISLVIIWYYVKRNSSWKNIITQLLLFIVPSLLIYLLSVSVYIHFYLPVQYNVRELVNTNLFNIPYLFVRFADINSKLIFSEHGVNYYAYFVFIFLTVLIFDMVFSEKLNKTCMNWLFAVFAVYLGLAFIGYLLPLYDLDNSTKRGLFKMFPPMLLYMANSSFLMDLSGRLNKWEMGCRKLQ